MSDWRRLDGLRGGQMLDLPPVWLLGALLLARAQVWLWPDLSLPHPVGRLVGGAALLAGLALIGWAAARFRASGTTIVPHQRPARLITDGPFALSRNPIYLGDLLILAGAVLWWGAWPSLLLIPALATVLTRRFIAPEEARLKDNFGPEFADYTAKTRRWL